MIQLVISSKSGVVGLEKFKDNTWYCMVFPEQRWRMNRIIANKKEAFTYFTLT